jgi:hypothetical protein
MSKFEVGIGRLVREQAVVVVEAPSAEAIDVHDVYTRYEGDGWQADEFWGVDESEAHDGVIGAASDAAEADVTILEG